MHRNSGRLSTGKAWRRSNRRSGRTSANTKKASSSKGRVSKSKGRESERNVKEEIRFSEVQREEIPLHGKVKIKSMRGFN